MVLIPPSKVYLKKTLKSIVVHLIKNVSNYLPLPLGLPMSMERNGENMAHPKPSSIHGYLI